MLAKRALYLHFDDSVTFLFALSASSTAFDACRAFAAALAARRPKAPRADDLRLRVNGAVLGRDAVVAALAGQDVSVELAPALSEGATAALLERAAQLTAAKQLRAANQLYEEVLAGAGGDGRASAREALLGLATNATAVEAHERAVACLTRASDARPQDVLLLHRRGEALLAACHAAEAVRCFDAALAASKRLPAAPGAPSEHDLLAGAAQALLAAGNRNAAAQLVTRVLAESGQSHPGALLQYAHLAAAEGNHADSLAVLLRLLAQAPKDRRLRESLAAAVARPGGVTALRAHLEATGPALVSILAFCAAAAKDGGAAAAAAELLQLAVRESPGSASCALAAAHAHEAAGQDAAALAAVAAFFGANRRAGVGGVPLAAAADVLTQPPLPPLPGDTAAGCGWLLCDAAGPEAPPLPPLPPAGSVAYSDADLDAVACLCLAAKLLYAHGALARCRRISLLAAAALRGSQTPPHQTSIRNEAAYAGAVAALLALPAPAPVQPVTPLYCLGDSHVLPLAWRPLTRAGVQHTLVPALVTGLKAWHLRPGCCFYPAGHWAAVTAQLPPGAPVLVLVGEIDCREGLLAAVERGRYASLTAAATATARLLVTALRSLAVARGFRFLCHPAPPVLDVTRPSVRAFNAALRQAVAAAAPCAPGSLAFLELEAGLLGAEGGLLPGYSLDGTHLHPSYVGALQAAADAL